MPILEPIDSFMLQNEYSPLITFISGYLVCYFYPSLKQWSTARGDTTIIIGSVVGFSIGSYLSNYLGYLNKPDEPPLYNIIFPDALGYLFGVIRTILGLSTLMATRLFFKSSLLKFLCAIYKCDIKDPATRQQKKIELPFNYITYFGIGLNIAFISPLIFRYLGIQRDYSFTEL
jgi:sphingosine-1-phosphate phosphatase 1